MKGIAPAGDQGEHLLPRLEVGDQCVELGEEVLEHEMSFRGGDGSTLPGGAGSQ